MKSLFSINGKNYNLFAFLLQVMFFLFALVIVLQLLRLQVFESGKLREKSRQMRQPAKAFSFRGEIVDRNGLRLASDITLYDIYAHPQYYYDENPQEMAEKLAPYLKKTKEELFKKLNNRSLSTITLAKGIERKTALDIKKLKLKGLDLVKRSERAYPQGNLASHILGYINPNANISAGVERAGSKKLEALPNVSPVEYDGMGNVIYDFDTDPNYAAFPLMGDKLQLTIDSSIQHIAETELQKMVQKMKADRGTVIVMNPKNGEILGFAVLPSYNPNLYNKANPSVLKNWVLSDVYPPGSTFKIITIASALESGAINEFEKIQDTGQVKIQGWTITNYDYGKKGAPGVIDLNYLFVHSSNVGSAKVANKIPYQTHYNLLRSFGIGSKTGIDLPGESSGIIPKWNKWDKITQATIGFGYSIASTPIQVISAVSAIANNGVWVTPHVIKYTGDEFKKRIKARRVLSSETSKKLTKILAKSIQDSDSKAGKIPNFTVAGKTGTSRKPNPNGPGYLTGQVFTSFVGFFPSTNPQIVMMVVVDNPKGCEVWGSTVAGPVFNNVAAEVTRILNLKPDAPGLNTKDKENT